MSRKSWADLYAFEVNRPSRDPVFRQVYQQIRMAILTRRLRPGTKLRPTRELAREVAISRAAGGGGYGPRLAGGYASVTSGSGTYVSSDVPDASAQNVASKKRP